MEREESADTGISNNKRSVQAVSVEGNEWSMFLIGTLHLDKGDEFS